MRRTGPARPARLVAGLLCFSALLALAGCGGTPAKGDEFAVNMPGQLGSNIIVPPRNFNGDWPVPKSPAVAAEAPAMQGAAAPADRRQAAQNPLPGMIATNRQRTASNAPRGAKRAAPKLIGMRAEEISSLLGQPTLLRQEPPAQVWQYASDDCVLYVFLYRNHRDTGRSRVRYVESRDPATAAREPTPPCVNQFMHRHKSGNVS